MRHFLLTLAAMALCTATAAAQQSKATTQRKTAQQQSKAAAPTFTEWHDLQVNAINRFPLHSHFFAYENRDAALCKTANHLVFRQALRPAALV